MRFLAILLALLAPVAEAQTACTAQTCTPIASLPVYPQSALKSTVAIPASDLSLSTVISYQITPAMIQAFLEAQANSWTGSQTFANISVDGPSALTGNVTSQQSTAATSGANNSSYSLVEGGTYWNGTASANDTWTLQDILGTGTNPSSTLTVTHAGSTGTAAISLPAISTSGPVQNNVTQATLPGTSAGSAVSSEPQSGSSYKMALVYLNGYENTTATAQTITFPTAFLTANGVVTLSGSCTGVTASLTAITLPASMAAVQTGLCKVEGY